MTNRFTDPLKRYLDRRNSLQRTSQFIRGTADHLDPPPRRDRVRRSLEDYWWNTTPPTDMWSVNWETTNTSSSIYDLNTYNRLVYGYSAVEKVFVPHNEHCVEVDGRWFCSINCEHKK